MTLVKKVRSLVIPLIRGEGIVFLISMPPLVVRPAAVQDISAMVQIRRRAISDEEIRGFSTQEPSIFTSAEKLRQGWDRENILHDGFRVFVAEHEMGIAGFIVFKMERDYGYIDNLVVAKEMQGKGVGRALVTYVEDLTKTNGCNLIKTDTTENARNVPWKSYGFWINMGYEDTGERFPTPYDFKEIPFVKRLN